MYFLKRYLNCHLYSFHQTKKIEVQTNVVVSVKKIFKPVKIEDTFTELTSEGPHNCKTCGNDSKDNGFGLGCGYKDKISEPNNFLYWVHHCWQRSLFTVRGTDKKHKKGYKQSILIKSILDPSAL